MNQSPTRQFFYAAATAAILSLSTTPVFAADTSHTSNSRSAKNVQNEHMISADKLQGATVFDNHDKDVGKIKTIFLDAKTGKIQRADVDFSTGTGKTYSVPWSQLHVSQKDNGDIVAKVDESVIRRVQEAKDNNNNQRSSTR